MNLVLKGKKNNGIKAQSNLALHVINANEHYWTVDKIYDFDTQTYEYYRPSPMIYNMEYFEIECEMTEEEFNSLGDKK